MHTINVSQTLTPSSSNSYHCIVILCISFILISDPLLAWVFYPSPFLSTSDSIMTLSYIVVSWSSLLQQTVQNALAPRIPSTCMTCVMKIYFITIMNIFSMSVSPYLSSSVSASSSFVSNKLISIRSIQVDVNLCCHSHPASTLEWIIFCVWRFYW